MNRASVSSRVVAAVIETLEARQLMSAATVAHVHHGIVSVDCGKLNDVVIFTVSGDQLTVSINGNEQHFNRSSVKGIRASGGKGNDDIEATNFDHDFNIPMTLSGGAGSDTITGGESNDVLRGDAGDDFMYGGGGNDRMRGGAGNDLMTGEAGNDTLFGGAGNDVLGGGDGNDKLFGRDGDDSVYGEAGNDTLTGGRGADVLDVGEAGGANVVHSDKFDTIVAY